MAEKSEYGASLVKGPWPGSGRLKSGGNDGTSGGMDGDWKTSVESRLGSINTDIRELRTSTNASSINIATLTERVAHLPSKGFIVTVSLLTLTVASALIAFQGQIQNFLKIPH